MTTPMPPAKFDKPFWPPLWNPFEVFILLLAMVSSIGLIHGSSGSKVLDERLNDAATTMWGLALAGGALMALMGLWCYRRVSSIVPGLYLERSGLFLVGVACAVYVVVILKSAADLNDARYTAAVNSGFAAACFKRALQDHAAIKRALAMAGKRPWSEFWGMVKGSFSGGDPSE